MHKMFCGSKTFLKNDGGALDDLLCLDMETMGWKKVEMDGLPSARRYHVLERRPNTNKYVTYGGYDGDHDNPLSDLFEMDFDSSSCVQLLPRGDLPEGRLRHTLVAIGEKQMLLLGGMNPHREFARQPYVLTLDDLKWHKVKDVGQFYPLTRGGHKMSRVSEYGWVVVGGYTHQRIHSTYFMDSRAIEF